VKHGEEEDSETPLLAGQQSRAGSVQGMYLLPPANQNSASAAASAQQAKPAKWKFLRHILNIQHEENLNKTVSFFL
jgi:hypothetical protein